MKTQVDIVTGFLGSGKTTFINSLLNSDKLAEKKIVVLQCESGEEELESELPEDRELHVEKIPKGTVLSGDYIKSILDKYLPDRVIIEHNGMSNVGDLQLSLQGFRLSRSCNLNKVFHLIDSGSFEVYMNNMGPILTEQISGSDMIIANNIDGLSLHKRDNMFKTLETINKSAPVLCISTKEEFGLAVEHDGFFQDHKGFFSKASDKYFIPLFALIVLYLLYNVFRAIGISNPDLSGLRIFNTIFISILVQAFPFILFGVFISSIIQVFISQEAIVRFFPRNKIAAFLVAIISGFFLPVCDCAIIPVAGRLVRKGVPLPVAVTFMLAAPIVNPIVIASTFYAFPGNPSVAFYRLYLGITVAVVVGLTFMLFPQKESVLRDNTGGSICRCGCCDSGSVGGKGIMNRINAVFMHASMEFFEVSRFLIIGALLSTVVQTVLPKEALANLGNLNVLSLLVMMASAFILSICSTSDAFIARTFTGQFAMGPVMGFMVLGPMVDIKNLLMLLGNYKKRFVAKLVFAIFGISFVLLYVFSNIIG